MNNILLLNLPIQKYLQKDFPDDNGYNPSLGLISIGTMLQLHGYPVSLLDLCYDKLQADQFIQKIMELQPVIIGISVYTETYGMAVSVAKLIKKHCPSIKIVFGGAHPSLMPEECINEEHVDFVVLREGEATFLELVEGICLGDPDVDYSHITGLMYKKNGEVIKNAGRPPIQDLDLLPINNRELADMDRYTEVVNVSTSRGCPGHCIYCSATSLSGANYRVRDIRNVFMEMVLIKTQLKEKLIKIYIVDDTFTVIPNRVKDFVNLIKEYKLNIIWHCESRVDVISKNMEMLPLMSSGGLELIQYGIESGSQDVLDKIGKGIRLDDARNVVEATYKNNIVPCLSFMLGHYCDSKETMDQTVDFIKEMFDKYKAEMAVSFNTPFPGTYQHRFRDKLGIRMVTSDYRMLTLLDPVVETDQFNVADQRAYFYKARKYLNYNLNLSKYRRLLTDEQDHR